MAGNIFMVGCYIAAYIALMEGGGDFISWAIRKAKRKPPSAPLT